MTRFAVRSWPSLKIDSGTSGAFATRASTSTKPVSSASAGGQRHDHTRRAPAQGVGADDPVGQAEQAGGGQQCAGEVEVPRPGAADVGGDHARCQDDDQRAERHVDGEDGRPSKGLGQDPAEQSAGRCAEPTDRSPQAKRAIAFGALAQRRGDDRQRGRRDDAAAEPLKGTNADQQAPGAGQGACQRGHGEQGGASDEDSPAPEQVGGACPEHHEAGERERVRVHDPLQARGREVQGVPHVGQRHIDDGDVEDDHELREADHEQQCVCGAESALEGNDGGIRFVHGFSVR